MSGTGPRSLVWATDLDVLPRDHTVARRGDHLVVRSPSNPGHWWGNLLLFDAPPRAGDRLRWEEAFRAAFAGEPAVRHMTFAWDAIDGAAGAGAGEFAAAGYVSERMVGLVAEADELAEHPRRNREVTVRALDPDGDLPLWEAVIALQSAEPFAHEEPAAHVEHLRRRQRDLRALFAAERGAWYVALAPGGTAVLGSCGIVVTGPRGRFQAVDTVAAHRRRGICSRLVTAAARDASARFGAERFVIAADPDYHALGLYESLGFVARERVSGVFRPPSGGSPRFRVETTRGSAAQGDLDV